MPKDFSIVFTILLLLAQNSFGQRVIYGKVHDATTHEPLAYVNVFVNNTTLGTTTGREGAYSLAMPIGEHEVVFSFVGYHSDRVKISIHGPDTVRRDVDLFPSTQELESITVNDTPDKEWQRLMAQFQIFFIGDTYPASQCTINNAWCIDLKKERVSIKQVLFARASQPLEIINLALGYKLFYDLQNFAASKQGVKFSGNVYFAELEPADSMQAETWAWNRQNEYHGSIRHLFRSILDQKLKEEGFTLFAYQTSGAGTGLKAYNPTNIQFDSLNRKYKITMEQNIQIQYKRSAGSNRDVSGMYFANGYVDVNDQGVVADPLSMITTGYLSNSRVASMLPEDYRPLKQSDMATNKNSGPDIAAKLKRLQESVPAPPVNKSFERDIQALAGLDSLEKKGNHYSENHPAEKVYIHFDKPYYVVGEDSWYKAYVVRGSDLNPTDISAVLYLDWINPLGKVISHQRLKIENGGAAGDLMIDSTFHGGTYTVRAYTNWMRNQDPELFYTKKIPVFSTKTIPVSSPDPVKSKIDLQFFPEGGTLLDGVLSQIAFKAIDGNGRGVVLRGQIIDEQDRTITTFQSSHQGMGVFPLVGDGHQSFRAVLPGGEVYPLPLASENGLTLAASNINNNKLLVRIQSTKKGESSAYLIGQSSGSICYAEYITMDGPSEDITIQKEMLPEGVLQLTLFNNEGIPECERMVFIKKDDGMVVTTTGDREQYEPRDSITLNFKVNDTKGNPVETSLSVSVSDASFISADRNSENIYTELLLQSDLKGNIENPGWYFSSQTAEKKYALDLVMLTHGWSRYNWKEILSPAANPVAFKPEKGITLEGEILANNKPAANIPFTLTAPQSGNEFFNIYESDSLGHFMIPDLDFSDSTLFSWRVMSGNRGKAQNAQIQLDTTLHIPPVAHGDAQDQTIAASKNELYEKLLGPYVKKGVWNIDSVRMLEEVVVKGRRMEVKAIGVSAIAIKPDAQDLQSRISTSQLVGRYSLASKILAISIDGFVGEGDPYMLLSGIPIEQIEVIAVAGNIHKGYSIAIRTKTPTSQEGFGTIHLTAKGYDAARQFYHPKYGPSDISAPGPDHRVTLYWNANLHTDRDGNAIVKFYNTDSTQKILITLEGIANGLTISTTHVVGKAD